MNIQFALKEFKEICVPDLAQLKWEITFWTEQRAKALEHVAAAWNHYNQAIEDGEPQDEINQLGIMAEIFEDTARECYRYMDDAKARLLARLN